MSTLLKIQLLGEFRLIYRDTLVTEVNTPRLQALLAYLILHRAAPQSRQQVAFRFWPDSGDAQARTNLRNALHQLRNALPEAEQFLQVDASTIQWRPDAPYTLDLALFEEAWQAAQTAPNPAAKRTALENAIQQYQGDLFPGCYEDWILPEREQWQRAYTNALEALITLLESQRDYRTALDYAQRLLQFDALREATYAQLMQLHALAGDRAAALRVYHTCATTLVNELGVEPGPTTHAIYEQLLNLEAPPPTTAPLRSVAPLIGRDQAWVQLQEAWRQAQRSQPSFILVAGEAGIGKTRLVEEMLEWAARQGIATAVAHCYAVGGRLAYAPVQAWLRAPIFRRAWQTLDEVWRREVARLAPDLVEQSTPPAGFTETWQRQRLFEALARLVFQNGAPLLLAIDDLQWCDSDTLEWLQYLLRFPQTTGAQPKKAHLLLIGTLRREELTGSHPLLPFLRQLGYANQLHEIELTRLTSQETAQLATNLLGHAVEPALAERLYAETEGNPLFVVEIMRAEEGGIGEWGSRGDELLTAPLPHHTPTPLPPKVQALIKARLEQLSSRAYALVCVAAVIGRAFAVDILAQASDSDEDGLVQGLDELWQQHIVREQGTDTYNFSHDKMREVAYGGLSPIRRRYLHRRVAQALEGLRANSLDAVSDQIATHYEHAGLAAQAIVYYQRAAQTAHRMSALQEAIAHLAQALTLLPSLLDNTERAMQELAIHVALGPLLLATKGYAAPEVEQAFHRAWELCRRLQPQSVEATPEQFQILWGLGRFYMVKPELTKALEASQQLSALAQATEEPDLLLEAFCSLGTHLFHLVDLPAARAYLEQSLALYDPAQHRSHALTYGQDPGVVAAAYLAWTLWCLGYPAQALAQTQAALTLAQQIDHPYSLVIATTYASVQYHFLNDVERCRAHAEAAIVLATQYGFTLWLSMATFLRGWTLTVEGDFDNGFADMQQSIDLFRSTGAELGAAYFAALLAETFGRTGQAEVGLLAMAGAFELLERTQDRWCEAEMYRLQGELYLQTDAPAEAETSFQTAITAARQQQARLWELRATISLARLWQQQDKAREARMLLAEIVDWFREGAELPDLVAAQTLLAEL